MTKYSLKIATFVNSPSFFLAGNPNSSISGYVYCCWHRKRPERESPISYPGGCSFQIRIESCFSPRSVLLLQETVTVIDNLPNLQLLFPDRLIRFILFFFLV